MENKENISSFEELLKELSEIVNELENGNLTLEEGVNKYQRGLELSLACKNKLEAAKQVVVNKVTENGEVPFK